MSTDVCYAEAIARCQDLFDRATKLELAEPLAMTLATADAQGRPSARMVLLRGFDADGFVFYTNSESRKGEDLANNPQAALCFYWEPLREQLRVEGAVETVTHEENDSYWATRTRTSQLAACASHQSRALQDRQTFEQRVDALEQKYAGREVPRPVHWHGYRVRPDRIEFWIGRDGRMHVRDLYQCQADGWTKSLLYP